MKNTDKIRNKKLYEMCLKHFNEPMISFGNIVRCIGYGETDADCYVLVRHKGENYKEPGKVHWNTCVGGYIFLNSLKGQNYVLSTNGEEWDDLYRLDNELELNSVPKEKTFMLILNHDDDERLVLLKKN